MNATFFTKSFLLASLIFASTSSIFAQSPMSLQEKEKREEEREMRFTQIRKSAEKGNVTAIIELANCYYTGTLTDKDHDLAFYWYKKGAEKKNPAAYYNLGNMYMKGQSVKKNEDKAYENYRKAAFQGLPEALINAAALADKKAKEAEIIARETSSATEQAEKIKEKNEFFKDARRFYEASFRQGNFKAKVALARYYEFGFGGKEDHKTAGKLYHEIAKGGHALSQLRLYYLYSVGKIVPKDDAESVFWLQLSANNDNPEAMSKLAYLYLRGIGGLPKDSSLAFKWFELAAKQGYPQAFVSLGNCYLEGFGTDKDPKRAIEYFKLGNSVNHPPATFNLAVCYALGVGTEKNLENAFIFYKRAADFNYGPALYKMAQFHKNGDFTLKQSNKDYLIWLQKAANAKHTKATMELADLYMTGTIVPKDRHEAKTLLVKELAKDNQEAIAILLQNFPFEILSFSRELVGVANREIARQETHKAKFLLSKVAKFGSADALDSIFRHYQIELKTLLPEIIKSATVESQKRILAYLIENTYKMNMTSQKVAAVELQNLSQKIIPNMNNKDKENFEIFLSKENDENFYALRLLLKIFPK